MATDTVTSSTEEVVAISDAENESAHTPDTDSDVTDSSADRRPAAARTAPLRKQNAAQSKSRLSKPDTASSGKAITTESESVAATTQSRSGRNRILFGVVGALLAVAVAVGCFFAGRATAPDGGGSDGDRATVTKTARDYAIKLSSFDYRSLDKNREAITAMSTPDFAKKYDEMVQALTQIVQNGKGEATATVSYAAVDSIDDSSAKVMLFVDQQAKNVVSPDGRSQPYRMVVTLKHSDGKWLVDNVETV